MVLPGTALANKVLKKTGLINKLNRQFTQLRANDRTHKLWGRFNEDDANKLVRKLTKKGASNARIVYTSYIGKRYVSGVRFEMPKED